MNFLKELLNILNRGVIVERMTSPHVLSRNDITVILNVIKKEFGLSYDTNEDIGLCMISQIVFSLAATAQISEKELADYIQIASHYTEKKTFNNLGKLISWFNRTPMRLKDKWVQFTLNAHAITSKDDLLKQLKMGQPVICAIQTNGVIDKLISDLEYDFPPHWMTDTALINDFKNGFISKAIWLKAKKIYRSTYNVYHASLCFGHESGDKAFLFREPRPSYGRKGYYKIADELFTPENLGRGKPLIHGMFYVEVVDMKEVPNPNSRSNK